MLPGPRSPATAAPRRPSGGQGQRAPGGVIPSQAGVVVPPSPLPRATSSLPGAPPADPVLHAPTPTLPLGAGGPRERAAGRAFSSADEHPGGHAPALRGVVVLDADPLRRMAAVQAAAALGLEAGAPGAAAVLESGAPPARSETMFVGLDDLARCPRCGPVITTGSLERPLVVGYVAGAEAVLAAHRLHACVPVVLRLAAVGGQARFVHPSPRDGLRSSGVTPREADVLLLLLAGCDTRDIAGRLWLSPATVRSHCRALLRKLGAADRRALRARLLGGPGPPAGPCDRGLRRSP